MSNDEVIAAARQTAEALYRGERIEHRSCGVAVAVTFGLNPVPYSILRRGGLTGERECGALRGGEMALTELMSGDQHLGLPDGLKDAVTEYRERSHHELLDGREDTTCNGLVRLFDDFDSAERKSHCTTLASQVAGLVAELALKYGAAVTVAPLPEH